MKFLDQFRKRQKPTTMNKIIINIVSTQRGWLIRQALKYTSLGVASFTAWLAGQGVIADETALLGAATSLVTGILELGLSSMASRIAAED